MLDHRTALQLLEVCLQSLSRLDSGWYCAEALCLHNVQFIFKARQPVLIMQIVRVDLIELGGWPSNAPRQERLLICLLRAYSRSELCCGAMFAEKLWASKEDPVASELEAMFLIRLIAAALAGEQSHRPDGCITSSLVPMNGVDWTQSNVIRWTSPTEPSYALQLVYKFANHFIIVSLSFRYHFIIIALLSLWSWFTQNWQWNFYVTANLKPQFELIHCNWLC